MLFYTKQKRYRNIKIVDKDGRELCKFTPVSNKVKEERGELTTSDKKLISILKNKEKYPWIFWYEEEKEPKKEEKLN